MSLHHILLGSGNYLTINKHLIKALGLDCAVYLGAIIDKENYLITTEKIEEGDSFYYSREDLEEDTTLSRHRQVAAEKILIDLEILTIETKGLPARNYLSIASDSVVKKLHDLKLKNNTTCSEKTAHHYIRDTKEEILEEREAKTKTKNPSDSVSLPSVAHPEPQPSSDPATTPTQPFSSYQEKTIPVNGKGAATYAELEQIAMDINGAYYPALAKSLSDDAIKDLALKVFAFYPNQPLNVLLTKVLTWSKNEKQGQQNNTSDFGVEFTPESLHDMYHGLRTEPLSALEQLQLQIQ